MNTQTTDHGTEQPTESTLWEVIGADQHTIKYFTTGDAARAHAATIDGARAMIYLSPTKPETCPEIDGLQRVRVAFGEFDPAIAPPDAREIFTAYTDEPGKTYAPVLMNKTEADRLARTLADYERQMIDEHQPHAAECIRMTYNATADAYTVIEPAGGYATIIEPDARGLYDFGESLGWVWTYVQPSEDPCAVFAVHLIPDDGNRAVFETIPAKDLDAARQIAAERVADANADERTTAVIYDATTGNVEAIYTGGGENAEVLPSTHVYSTHFWY